jgi:hypothetical protein
VCLEAADLEQHPEAATVDRLPLAGLTRKLAERGLGDERDVAAAAVDRGARRRLDEAQRTPECRRQRLRPWAVDDAAGDRPAVEVGDDLGAQYDGAVGNRFRRSLAASYSGRMRTRRPFRISP